MKDLCVTIPNFGDEQFAEIKIKVGQKKMILNYRVESFPWYSDDDFSASTDKLEISLARISRLKNAIEGYSKEWELIQIFNPSGQATHIQVLYRKK